MNIIIYSINNIVSYYNNNRASQRRSRREHRIKLNVKLTTDLTSP